MLNGRAGVPSHFLIFHCYDEYSKLLYKGLLGSDEHILNFLFKKYLLDFRNCAIVSLKISHFPVEKQDFSQDICLHRFPVSPMMFNVYLRETNDETPTVGTCNMYLYAAYIHYIVKAIK